MGCGERGHGEMGMRGHRDVRTWRCGHLPLALARVQDELLVAAGAEAQLTLRGVEGVQEQVALPGAAGKAGGSERPGTEASGSACSPRRSSPRECVGTSTHHRPRPWAERGPRRVPGKTVGWNKRVWVLLGPGPHAHDPAVPCTHPETVGGPWSLLAHTCGDQAT